MTLQEARETVVLAGKKLVESGLIARTWGNVSCRISDSHFVITPSGRDYLSLTPDEIVKVAISDLSYDGSLKPSSEKGVHSEVYKLYPEAGFVIHTHQDYASAISSLMRESIDVSKDFTYLNGKVICADYGLPGTKKLRRGVAKALAGSQGKAVIMKNHGALCFGLDYQETFKVAHELEDACKRFIEEHYQKISNHSEADLIKIGSYAISKLTGSNITITESSRPLSWESKRTEKGFSFLIDDKTIEIGFDIPSQYKKDNEDIYNELIILNEIYKNNDHINHIIHTNLTGTTVMSYAGIKLLPFLDDFAQIVGTSVKTSDINPKEISKSLKSSSAVLLKNDGALCCGISRDDAVAVSMVLEKNCIAYIAAALLGKIKPINALECKLMRFVYQTKYSKLYKGVTSK